MSRLLDYLNEEQQMAVKTTEGYVRVIAGAGSGKTRALTHRYMYLVECLGISTANILCVTFTNKAANEMKKRIRGLIGDKDLALICTFHSFCTQVLHLDITKINFPTNFMILDSEDQSDILKKVYEDRGIKFNELTHKNAKDYIRDSKHLARTAEYINLFVNTNDSELYNKYMSAKSVHDKVFYGYIYEQKKCFGLDFDDLIILTLHIFTTFEDVLFKWQNKLQYIMVDEFQDVNLKQYALCSMLSKVHKNLFIVGDPDQNIYSWRGANVSFILNFDKNFEDVITIMMNKNYRSSPEIINVSNSLISKNKYRIEKKLESIKSNGPITIYNHAKTTYDEAQWISQQILTLINSGAKKSDIAILYRAHHVTRPIEESFMRNKINYTILSGISFYNRKEIKDVLCYLRMIVYGDDFSFLRTVNVPKRNIGKKRIEILSAYAKTNSCSLYEALKACLHLDLFRSSNAGEYIYLIEKFKKNYKEKNVTDVLNLILDESGYDEMLKTQGEDERLENLAELKNSIYDYEISSGEEIGVEDYLSKIALYTNLDKDDNKDTVKMMTIHTAKGLEFPFVFVCALNEGIFPSKRIDTLPKLEEERRLAYVAFTRAEKALFLSEAEGYNYDSSFRYPSRFIFNIDKEILKYSVELDAELVNSSIEHILFDEKLLELKEENKNNSTIKNNSKLCVGDLVCHSAFGEGKIESINEIDDSISVKFDNCDTLRTLSFRSCIENSLLNKIE